MASEAQTGAMIALIPTEADLDRLVVDEDGAEPRDELHLTLFYLGEGVDFSAETRRALTNAVTSMVENRAIPPVHARAFGYAHWNPTSDDPAWVLNVGDVSVDDREPDGQSLAEVRASIQESWFDGGVEFTLPTQHSPWAPHICLAYASDDWTSELSERLGDVTFDRVRLAFAGQVFDVPLGVTATVASTSGGVIVPWHVVENHAKCTDGKPWAVVKDADGSVAGCHASESDANDQLAALYASEKDGEHDVDTVAATSSIDEPGSELAAGTSTTTTGVSTFTFTTGANTTLAVPSDSPEATGGDGKAPPFKPKKSSTGDAQNFADKTSGDCPPNHRKLPDGSCVSEDEYATMSAWHGVLCVEGVTTGDGREFAADALTWADSALLRWQKESAHGGQHDVTVSVGRIDRVYREGNQILGDGVLDLESVDGYEIWRRLGNGFAGGISIDADDIQDADVEFVWSDEPDGTSDDDPLKMLFGSPEKMVFHAGRVRAATLVDIPAFVEARIQLGVRDATETVTASSFTSVAAVSAVHETATSDAVWDQSIFAKRLPNILPLETAREVFGYYGDVTSNRVAKTNCRFLHHEVDDDGTPGAANLTACASAVAELRKTTDLDEATRQYVYAHLAKHLRDAGQEPQPLEDRESIAAAVVLDDWRPDSSWFVNPNLSVPTGITVTDEGRVYGHAAQWGECHIGFSDQCVTLPAEDAHPYFMTGELVCSDGSRVAVGQITVGTGHAPLSYRASHAAEHYDNTGAAVADVAVGNDQFGIWVAGAIRASVAASRVHELRASGRVSGDWRRIGGQLRLVGLLAVNVPGFPIQAPRARVASGAPQALVAAGRTTVGSGPDVAPNEEQLDQLAMRRVMSLLVQRVRDSAGRLTLTEEVGQ